MMANLKQSLPRAQWFGLRDVLIALLLAIAAGLVWKINAQAHDISDLQTQLSQEQQAHAITQLSLNTAEFRAANRELDTEVRSDILDERIRAQAARAGELEKEAEDLRARLVREINCTTPRAIRNAEGL